MGGSSVLPVPIAFDPSRSIEYSSVPSNPYVGAPVTRSSIAGSRAAAKPRTNRVGTVVTPYTELCNAESNNARLFLYNALLVLSFVVLPFVYIILAIVEYDKANQEKVYDNKPIPVYKVVAFSAVIVQLVVSTYQGYYLIRSDEVYSSSFELQELKDTHRRAVLFSTCQLVAGSALVAYAACAGLDNITGCLVAACFYGAAVFYCELVVVIDLSASDKESDNAGLHRACLLIFAINVLSLFMGCSSTSRAGVRLR